jgi:hypothetical protein
VCGDRADICLKAHGLGRGGADDGAAPPPGGWAPRGLAGIATLVPQHPGVQPTFRGLEVPEGLCPRAAPVAAGGLVAWGAIAGGQLPGPHPPGSWPRSAALGVHPSPRLVRHAGGGHDPTVGPLLAQIARAPGAAGARLIDTDEACGLGVERAGEVIEVGGPGAEGPTGADRGAVRVSAIGARDGSVLDVSADVQGARLGHGGPPRVFRCRPEAALAPKKLPRGATGGQPTPRKS